MVARLDGVMSDMKLTEIECIRGQLDPGEYRCVRNHNDHRDQWLQKVADHHLLQPADVKRGPNALANGSGYDKQGCPALLRDAGLAPDAPPERTLVLPLKEELPKLRHRLLALPRQPGVCRLPP